MRIVQSTSSLFNNILVPEVFISQVLPGLSGDSVRLYLYLLYLVGRGQSFSLKNLMSELRLNQDSLDACLVELQTAELLVRSADAITLNCLSEIKLHAMYRPVEAVSPSQVPGSGSRAEAIDTINRLFFNGLMSSVWYTTVDKWFKQYGFDPEVMVMLFHQCKKYDRINVNYGATIAESWHSCGIRTMADLEQYELRFSERNKVCNKIVSVLNLGRRLTDFEMNYVNKWLNTYGYGYDIIELALSRSVRSTKISFDFFDRLLTEWHGAGLTTVEQVQAYEEDRRAQQAKKGSGMRVKTPNGNFSQSDAAEDEELKKLIRRNKES